MDIDSFIEERCPLFGVVNARQRLNKHLSGKHDQSTHGRKGRITATHSTAQASPLEPRMYWNKGLAVIDTATPVGSEMKTIGSSNNELAVEKIMKTIFEMEISTPFGKMSAKVEEVRLTYDDKDYLVNGSIMLKGKPVGEFTRSVSTTKPEVENIIFKLDPEFQRTGIGTTIIAHWEDQLARAGVKKMTVGALSRVSSSGPEYSYNGAYTWATYGYKMTNKEAKVLLTDFMKVLSWEGARNDARWSQREQILKRYKLDGREADDEVIAAAIVKEFGGSPLKIMATFPLFKGFLKGEEISFNAGIDEVAWKGYKRPKRISKSSETDVSIADKWMRTKPAELENEDPRFLLEIKSTIGSD